ncbi:hypothetical protein GUH13_10190, partial [Xanthomonas citri pv. citri]|nr:hypothetical protein [Xanthomonas citri pv. citri]
MTDYVSHEGVESVAGTVERVGGTRRRQVAEPGIDPPADDLVRVVLDGST